MLLTPATPADLQAVVHLANLAYRSNAEGWTSEAGVIEGPRLTLPQLQADLAAKPHAHLLLYRELPKADLLGTVWLEPGDEAWYLGLLTIHPSRQNSGLGRTLLATAEDFARAHGATRIHITVLNVRTALLAWYQRRGYAVTGASEPFPYGTTHVGTPLRNDLAFLVLEKQLRSER